MGARRVWGSLMENSSFVDTHSLSMPGQVSEKLSVSAVTHILAGWRETVSIIDCM